MTGPHWAFSLAVYGQPGVAPACVLLQDRCGVDVNVLLLALFAATRLNIAIDRSRIEALDTAITDLRTQVIVPLRQIRRHMKSADYGPATEQARNKVKIAELTAEQLEQAALAAVLDTWQPHGAKSSSARAVVEQVVLHYGAKTGVGHALEADIRTAIATVAEAVRP